MTNLAKTKGSHFKRYKSGNIRWYLGTGEYKHYQNLLFDYLSGMHTEYYKNPLLYAVIRKFAMEHFQSILEVESIKIEASEAVAVLMLLAKYKESEFLIAELQNILAL